MRPALQFSSLAPTDFVTQNALPLALRHQLSTFGHSKGIHQTIRHYEQYKTAGHKRPRCFSTALQAVLVPKSCKVDSPRQGSYPGATEDGASQAGFDRTCQADAAVASKKPQVTEVTCGFWRNGVIRIVLERNGCLQHASPLQPF